MSTINKTRMTKILSMVVVLVMVVGFCAPLGAIEVNAASAGDIQTTPGANTYALFNSGRTSSSPSYSSSSPSSFNNNGYDFELWAVSSSRVGLSFTVTEEVIERATVTINAYDVDESSGERDEFYLVDETDGTKTPLLQASGKNYLGGMDMEWNTTTMYVDAEHFDVGHTYHLELRGVKSGWVVYIRTISIALTTSGGGPVQELITSHAFSGAISDTGLVTTALEIATSVDYEFNLEYSASINGDQRGSSLNQSVSATPSGVTKNVSFQLENGSPVGIYTVTVTLKDSNGNTKASYFFTASKGAVKAVNYDANGGSNNVPIDNTQYSTGNTVNVRFDYVPSRYGYNFLGWARSSTATTPEFTADGNKTFTIGSSDVTLYAVWQEIVLHTHTEGEWIIDSAPTCDTEGSKHTVCTECGDVVSTESIAKLPHTESDWIIDVSATCTTDGSKHKKCTECDEQVGETVIIPALGHTESGWTVDVEATCTTDGHKYNKCTTCDQILAEESVSALGHSVSDWIVISVATCTTSGYSYTECTRCHEKFDEQITPAFGHTESDWIVVTEPTASTTGYKHTVCSTCGNTVRREIIPVLALIDVDDVYCGAGATVEVSIFIQNNPGITGAAFTLEYDSALTLVDSDAGSAWSVLHLTKPNGYESSCRFVWNGTGEVDSENGTVLTLTFIVPENVSVDATFGISVTDADIIGASAENINVGVSAGSITIDRLLGDVNGDGRVDVLDVVTLRRYLSSGYDVTVNEAQADMNGDGVIGVADIIAIRQYIVNNGQ